jgi:flagellar biosynthetic protein FliQ
MVIVMIETGDVINIITQAVTTVVISAAPMLVVAMVVGLIVSIFQATTQINEQTLAFVPKIVLVMLALIVFGSFIFSTVGGFVVRLFESINTMTIS